MTHRREASVELEVPFHDVDVVGVVWHGHYYKYFELARTALFRGAGLDVEDFLRLGHGLLVIDTHCRYVRGLRYGERFRVTATLADVDHRILVKYEIVELRTGRRAARGSTALVTTDAHGRMLLETPDAIRERLLA